MHTFARKTYSEVGKLYIATTKQNAYRLPCPMYSQRSWNAYPANSYFSQIYPLYISIAGMLYNTSNLAEYHIKLILTLPQHSLKKLSLSYFLRIRPQALPKTRRHAFLFDWSIWEGGIPADSLVCQLNEFCLKRNFPRHGWLYFKINLAAVT